MASTLNSNLMTNILASPQVFNSANKSGGKLRVEVDSFEVATTYTDGAGDKIRLCRVPADAVPVGLYLMSDDLDSGGTALAVDIGIEDVDGNVKDADAFASAATTLSGATAVWTDLLCEAGAVPLALLGKKMYEWAGDSDASEGSYDIVIAVTTAATTSAAGTLAFKFEWLDA